MGSTDRRVARGTPQARSPEFSASRSRRSVAVTTPPDRTDHRCRCAIWSTPFRADPAVLSGEPPLWRDGSPAFSSSTGAGHEGGHDVRGVPIKRTPRAVVAHRGPGICRDRDRAGARHYRPCTNRSRRREPHPSPVADRCERHPARPPETVNRIIGIRDRAPAAACVTASIYSSTTNSPNMPRSRWSPTRQT